LKGCKINAVLEGSALVGIEFPMSEENRWQTGFSYYQAATFEVEGQVQQLSDPAYTSFEFNYKVNNQRILWENRWLSEVADDYFFYLMGGLGIAFNRAYDFDENNELNPAADIDPFFKDKTTTSLTYSFGVGVETEVIEDLRLGLGYQYSDLGKVELDTFEGQVTDDTIQTSSSPAQEILLMLTYFF
jgi:opacity protein-like surface antigen